MENKKPSICVLIPAYGTVPVKSFASITTLLMNSGRKFPINVLILESTIIFESRNILLEEFLKTNSDYAFFLDSDMIVPSDLIEKLVEQDKDVISSLAFTRTMPPRPAIRKKIGESYQTIEDYPQNALIEVDAVGLYSMLIKREAVQKILDQTKGNFFDIKRNEKGELKGEDIIFCENIKKSGFKIFVHTGIKIGHYGGIIFPR